jgi:hypothetical protein
VDVPAPVLRAVTGWIARVRRRPGARPWQRAATVHAQVLLVLRWLRHRADLHSLAADTHISDATAYRSLQEGLEVIAAHTFPTCTGSSRMRRPVRVPTCADGQRLHRHRCAHADQATTRRAGRHLDTILRAVAGLVSSQGRAPRSDQHYQAKALTADAAGCAKPAKIRSITPRRQACTRS